MKILIVSIVRCGSTSLSHNIANEYSLKPLIEPFGHIKENREKNRYESSMDDVVVKTIVGQIPNFYTNNINLELLNKWEDWIIEFSKEFDKVILLSRRDLNAASESFSVASFYNKSWSKPYKYEKLPNLEQSKKIIDQLSVFLNKTSENLQIPITYYEDIFDENSTERLRRPDSEELPKIEIKLII